MLAIAPQEKHTSSADYMEKPAFSATEIEKSYGLG
jgi:hypothetical protein